MKKPKHPMQPLVVERGVCRFKKNAIVRRLLDEGGIDLNQIAWWDVSQDDRVQFAQLIGYSLSGFHELSYVPDVVALAATKAAREIDPSFGGCRDSNCSFHTRIEEQDDDS